MTDHLSPADQEFERQMAWDALRGSMISAEVAKIRAEEEAFPGSLFRLAARIAVRTSRVFAGTIFALLTFKSGSGALEHANSALAEHSILHIIAGIFFGILALWLLQTGAVMAFGPRPDDAEELERRKVKAVSRLQGTPQWRIIGGK